MELPKQRYSENNRDEIVAYLEAGGQSSDIILTAKQQQLLDRWTFADEKIRENKYRRYQIVEFLMARAAELNNPISKDTAWRDIVNAEYVFSSSYPLNKKYLIGARIEFLQKKINEAYIDKDRMTAALLERQLAKYIEIYPDYVAPRSPKTIIYNLSQTNIYNSNDVKEAEAKIDNVIKVLESNDGK